MSLAMAGLAAMPGESMDAALDEAGHAGDWPDDPVARRVLGAHAREGVDHLPRVEVGHEVAAPAACTQCSTAPVRRVHGCSGYSLYTSAHSAAQSVRRVHVMQCC
jgi:hypothetical protein